MTELFSAEDVELWKRYNDNEGWDYIMPVTDDVKYKTIIFDVDGTLVKTWTDELLPGVKEWFRVWAAVQGKPNIAFATNQGGPTLKQWMLMEGWGEPHKLPNLAQVIFRMMGIRKKINDVLIVEIPIFISTAYQTKEGEWKNWPYVQDRIMEPEFSVFCEPSPTWRKPQPGMLDQATQYFRTPVQHCLMVGDSEDDKQAALNFEMDFRLASEFFS